MPKPLRQQMPTVAGWIDSLRDAFGKEVIDSAIRAGMDGQHTFNARENSHAVGTPIPYDPDKAVPLSAIDLYTPPTPDNRKESRRG